MIYVLAIALAVLMGLTLISLLRGLNAFREGMNEDRGEATGATEMQLLQNRMMWARIKYQAAAVVVVMILLAMAR
ncbi:MAG: HIG1 domain-containing protein [Novosphingobium sp.]|nr:HIG1 domain-containing protein [Novosphingobium sp.]